MTSPGLARDWMREQEVAARPVRTLYEFSGRHWPPSLVRTILLATSDADASRASGDRGIERVRMQMRAPSTRPARDSLGMGVVLIAAVGMAVAECCAQLRLLWPRGKHVCAGTRPRLRRPRGLR